jgi:hypothetical protein
MGKSKILYIYLIAFLLPIMVIVMIELIRGYGSLEVYRFIYYGIIFAPFFVGLAQIGRAHV